MAIYGTSLGRDPGHATPTRRRDVRASPPRPGRRRQPARRRVRRQRRPRVEREPDPRRRRRERRSARRAALGRRRHVPPVRSRWPPANTCRCARSASCTSTRSASSATSSSSIRRPKRRNSRSSMRPRACRPPRRPSSRSRMVADPEHALDTLAREELGLNPEELGSPWGAAICRSCVRRGRAAAARSVRLRAGTARAAHRDRDHRGVAVRGRRAAVALHRPQLALLGRPHAAARRHRRCRDVRDRSPGRRGAGIALPCRNRAASSRR